MVVVVVVLMGVVLVVVVVLLACVRVNERATERMGVVVQCY